MKTDISDKYIVYRLAKKRESEWSYIKRHGSLLNREVTGICALEFLFESSSIEEIFEYKPIVELFYMCGDKNVKPFALDKESTFCGMEINSENGVVIYHTNGNALIKGRQAFEYIFKTYYDDIIFIIDAWNMVHIKAMNIYLKNREKKYQRYNVKVKKG